MRLLFGSLLSLWSTFAAAGSITVTIVEAGFSNVTRTYTISDADLVRIRAANQIAANAAVNAPATRVQILNYWIMNQWITPTIQNVQSYERQTAMDALPTPAPINPQ